MIEQSLFSTLSSLVSGRMYPLVAPDSPTCPYIVYQNIANTPEVMLDGSIPLQNTRIQIDVYDKTYAAVKTLKASIDAAMLAATFRNVPLMQRDLYEAEVKLYRIQQDYSIWY